MQTVEPRFEFGTERAELPMLVQAAFAGMVTDACEARDRALALVRERAAEMQCFLAELDRRRAFEEALELAEQADFAEEELQERSARMLGFERAMALFDQIDDEQRRQVMEMLEEADPKTPDLANAHFMLNVLEMADADGWEVSSRKNGTLLFESEAGRFFDSGSAIVGDRGHATELAGMIELAAIKGWDAVKPTGPREFKERAMVAALERGLDVLVEIPDLPLLAAARKTVAMRNQADILLNEYDERQDEIGRLARESVRRQHVIGPNELTAAEEGWLARQDRNIAAQARAAAFAELPIFERQAWDVVTDRTAKARLFAQNVDIVGRTESGNVIGKAGGGYVEIAAAAFGDSVPRLHDRVRVHYCERAGRDTVAPLARERETIER